MIHEHAGTGELAALFGCSAKTVARAIDGALGAAAARAPNGSRLIRLDQLPAVQAELERRRTRRRNANRAVPARAD